MPTNSARILALTVLPLTLAVAALTGCAASDPTPAPAPASDSSADGGSAPASGEDFGFLLEIEQSAIAVIAEQWINNDCSVDLALSPDDIVCADILAGADLAASYEEVAGGLDSLEGDPAATDALRAAFEASADAGRAWSDAGCADEITDDCADEGEELISTLLALDTAFDAWSA
ncbi:hypothetical protein CLV46_2496 [Diaminobutyricimonas aerilata]|uniref:Uncharacterized protein n=1 Tax=Diaminobutyricimonas aerilata TaxID=1162967 RepID=A0A2M9CLY4_9MICO|nr:hypothetical protein [Diaminobutyricimonas aerilata]PJJ72917.1 hypothetical protein CLV46_2496 [Diaminobutyricimonas aerilata]